MSEGNDAAIGLANERMKRTLVNLAKSRYFVPSLMMTISLVLLAYAVTSISISNTITITSGGSVKIIYQTTTFSGSNCPTTGYTTNPSGFSFSEPAGGSTSVYLCVNNVGTGVDNPTIAITSGDPMTCGSGTSPCFSVTPTSLTAIPPGGFSAPTNVTISNSFSAAQPSPVTVTITVT